MLFRHWNVQALIIGTFASVAIAFSYYENKVLADANTRNVTMDSIEHDSASRDILSPVSTFVVNVKSDQSDIFIGDGICDSDALTAGNQCSLRAAIQEANTSAGSDNISFSIPGSGTQVILLTSSLPIITGPVVADGYTQPGSVPNTLVIGNNAIINIEVRQTQLNGNIFIMNGGNSVIRGLIFNGAGDYTGSTGNMVTFNSNGGNRVEGCWFGINSDGTLSSIRTKYAVEVNSSNNVVGGPVPANRNVITNTLQSSIDGQNCSNQIIQNNYLGTDPSGMQRLGNTGGIFSANCASSLIGSPDPSARNVIVSRGDTGIYGGVSNTIQNNYINISADGTTSFGLSNEGIFVMRGSSVSQNVIRRIEARGITVEDNISIPSTITSNNVEMMVSGTGLKAGIYMLNGSNNNVIKANRLSVVSNVGSSPVGVLVNGSNNQIGGTENLQAGNCAGDCNSVSSFSKGVVISSGTGNRILGNSIYSSGLLGIDLGDDGVSNNDFRDADDGANRLQNFPNLTSVSLGSTTRVQGVLQSTPSRAFRLEFFLNPSQSTSGYGEGRIYLGTTNVTTDSSGNIPFDVTFNYQATASGYVSATATDSTTNDTSEFSLALFAQGPNRPPLANNDAYATNEDTSLTVSAPGVLSNDTDPDNDPLTAILVTGPTHGTLTLNPNGSFIYTPNLNYNGADSFTYKANDGPANSNIATVNITVIAVNDAPVAVNDSYSTNEDTVLTVPAPGVLGNDTDVDSPALTAILVTATTRGALTLNPNGSFSYTPNLNFNGADSFTYKANDGSANSNIATVNITINPINDPPVAIARNVTVIADASCTATVAVSAVDNGSFDVDGPGDIVSRTLTPAGPFPIGTTNVTLTVTDTQGAQSQANATITVQNPAPILSYNDASATPGGTIAINPATGPSDTNGTVSSIVVQSQGAFTGTISVNSAGTISIGNAGPVGAHNINIRATDNCGATTSANFTLNVAVGPGVTVDGRVVTSDGRGLRNATVSIMSSQGVVQRATTSSFGFFSFANVSTGDTYTIRIASRLYRYSPQTVQVNGNLTLPDFVGLE